MTDIQLAKHLFETEGHSIVAAKDGKVVGTASGPGVGPLLKLVEEHRGGLVGAALADKVVGRAVALVCVELGILSVFGLVMSQTAIEVLSEHGIDHSAGTIVPTIMNRMQTDLCPIERGSQAVTNPQGATAAIRQVLATLRMSSVGPGQ